MIMKKLFFVLVIFLSGTSINAQQDVKITYRSGTYVGEINQDSKPEGKGIFIWNNGNRYEGTFKDGLVTGVGKIIYAEGSMVYEGEVVNGLKHGTGRLSWREYNNEIKVYEGLFVNDKITGEGKFYVINEQPKKSSWFDYINFASRLPRADYYPPQIPAYKSNLHNNAMLRYLATYNAW